MCFRQGQRKKKSHVEAPQLFETETMVCFRGIIPNSGLILIWCTFLNPDRTPEPNTAAQFISRAKTQSLQRV